MISHNLTCGQLPLAVPMAFSIGRGKPLQKIFVHFRIKILAKFIYNTKNLYNFILGNHRCLFRILLFVRLKITIQFYDYQLLQELSYPELTSLINRYYEFEFS